MRWFCVACNKEIGGKPHVRVGDAEVVHAGDCHQKWLECGKSVDCAFGCGGCHIKRRAEAEAFADRLVRPMSVPNGAKPTNPKDLLGSKKLPLHLFPLTAIAAGCLAFLEGALKYGRSNYRETGVRASIYVDATKRHLDSWFEGEDIDPESELDHLGKALACIAVLIDAKAAGKLEDDRQYPGGYATLVERLTPQVEQLKQRHKDRSVKHYTIQDA